MRRGRLNHTHASSLLLTRCRVGLAHRGNAIRTMQNRIAELNVIALAEQPPRRVRNVRGAGACFFLALVLAIQPFWNQHQVAGVTDEDALDEAMLLQSVTEASVERHLNRIFVSGVDECSIEMLFEEMDLPWDGFESELHSAVQYVLERMEDGNKVIYREGLIHLI